MRRIFPLLLLLACGPALREQQSLAARVKAAAASCKRQPLRCESAAICAARAQTAQKAIQTAQEARTKSAATPDQEADAAGAYAAADSACKAGAW